MILIAGIYMFAHCIDVLFHHHHTSTRKDTVELSVTRCLKT